MGRIVKQYQDAIKAHKLGKPYPLDELPNPPGFVLIIQAPEPPKPTPAANSVSPLVPPKHTPTQPIPDSSTKPSPPPRANSVRKMGNQSSTTHNEKQINVLLARQKEFKEAAIQAKKKGELAQAKEFLRTAKGFDRVIEAARCGLPVEMESLPIPPKARSQLEDR